MMNRSCIECVSLGEKTLEAFTPPLHKQLKIAGLMVLNEYYYNGVKLILLSKFHFIIPSFFIYFIFCIWHMELSHLSLSPFITLFFFGEVFIVSAKKTFFYFWSLKKMN